MSRGKSVTSVLGTPNGIAHNESNVCDVALSPTRAKGHVAERRDAAPRSPSRPAGAAMYIRAVMRSCATILYTCSSDSIYLILYRLNPIPFTRLPFRDLT
jgi:hypothetical protein